MESGDFQLQYSMFPASGEMMRICTLSLHGGDAGLTMGDEGEIGGYIEKERLTCSEANTH